MRLLFHAKDGKVTAVFEVGEGEGGADWIERVSAAGETLTEAVENLIERFAELQQYAIEEMRSHGVVRTERKSNAGEPS